MQLDDDALIDEIADPSGRSRSTSLDSASDGVSPTAPFLGSAEGDAGHVAAAPFSPLAVLFPVPH
eukprot:2316754-Heterocapsa_arctica.AAC.1